MGKSDSLKGQNAASLQSLYLTPQTRTNLRYLRYHSRSSLLHFILTWDMNVKRPDILDQGVLANRHGIGLFEESLICRIHS